jgi:hypothetical protein
MDIKISGEEGERDRIWIVSINLATQVIPYPVHLFLKNERACF